MGTTSEELKKLYAKLGGKDPKVAGFSAPGEILNAINEIPLPTEYELPTVTTEDAGDVLVVNEEGKWDKGEAGSGLPEVTTDDNGDILQVIEGAWAKAAMSKDVVVYEAEFATIGSTYYLANLINAVQKDIIDSIISGKTVLIKFYNAKTFNARQTIYYYLHTYIERNKQAYFIGDCFSTDNKSNKEYYYIKLEYTDSGTISLNLAQKQVPTPGDIYNGKILQVVNGQYVFVDPPASLPEVTTADNGDILQVVNGAWAKAKPETVVIEGIKYNDAAKLDMTQKEVADLVFAGQDVVLKLHPETDPNSFYYLRLVDVTDKIHFYNITRSPQATNYLWVDVSPTSTSDRATLNSMTVGD